MKILLYSDCFIFGGSENVIENILKSEMLSSKYELKFYYAYNKRYKLKIDEKFPGFTNIFPLSILSAFNRWGYDVWLNQKGRLRYGISLVFEKLGIYDVFNFLKLYKIFRKETPDILYINNGGYPGARSARIAAICARSAGIKSVVFMVNNLAIPQKNSADAWLDKKVNAAVKFFITASKAAKKTLATIRAIETAKCINIPNTLSTHEESYAHIIESGLHKEFSIGKNEFIIGSAGMLTSRKGFLFLIETAKILRSRTTLPFKIFIFGDGEQRSFLEAKIKEYELEHIVFLPGYRNNVLAYIKGFDVFISPSIANEDFPYVILEAMLLAKPVIGTNIAGIPEQVTDGYNGFVVPPGDATKLAEKIEVFLSRPDLIKIMGEKGFKKYSENFNHNHIMQCYDQLFQSL